MRVSTVVIASAFASVAACASFGAGSEPAGPSTPSDDDGGADRAAPVVANDATADSGGQLPPAAFTDIAFDKSSEVDDFERSTAMGGPFGWVEMKVSTTANVIGVQGCDNNKVCSGSVGFCENNSDGWGFLATDLDPTSRVMRVDFSMRIDADTHDAKGEAQVVSIGLESDRYIFLTDYRGTFRLGDQYRPNAVSTNYDTEFTDLGPVPAADSWAKYRLYLDLDAGVVALMKDGVQLGPARVLRQVAITRLQKLRMGITYAQYDNFHVTIDDVGLKRRYK